MTEQCEGCKFFYSEKMAEKKIGVCRRFPPQWTTDENGFQFPAMQEVGWCGEWKPTGRLN